MLLQTSSEECFRGQLPAECPLTGRQRHRFRLFPSNTDIVLKQIANNTIDYEHWYPLYNYASTFNIADTLPVDSSLPNIGYQHPHE